MDDSGIVRRRDARRDLRADRTSFLGPETALPQPLLERDALHVFEDEVSAAVLLRNPVDRGDVPMVQGRERLRLSFEASAEP